MSSRIALGSGLFVGQNQRSLSRRVWAVLKGAVAGIFTDDADRAVVSLPQVQMLESRQLLSATWFVSPSGSDGAGGSISAPFKTIQHAANLAQPGDKVEIETGTYHETVTPAHSGTTSAPIIFQAYNGENVTITGADSIGGWSNYKGNIYVTSMPWDLGEGNNQIYVGNQALVEAAYPNTSANNISHPATAKIDSVSGGTTNTTIHSSSLNQPAGFWNGAIIRISPGQAWDGQTGIVKSSQPGSIVVSYQYHSVYAVLQKGNSFSLFGRLGALDTAGEFYRDSSGKLYAWMPNGASPAGQDVEAKHRLNAFNLNSVNNITIQGVHLFGSNITTGSGSRNVVINGITAKYVSQDMVAPHGWWDFANDGIVLDGANDVLENSTIQYSSGEAVVVKGAGSLVENNVVLDAVYNATNVGAIEVYASHVTIDHNSVTNSGRHGIDLQGPGAKITYNYVQNVGLQTTEAGAIYSAGLNAGGAVMAYNIAEHIHTGGYGGTAFFIDNNSSGWSVNHNISSDVDYGLKMNFTSNNNNISNNTLGATKLSINTNQKGNWLGTTIANNIFLAGAVFTPGAKVLGNVYGATSDASKGAGHFAAGSKGVDVPPVVIDPPVVSDPPPVTTPPVTTPPVITPPITTPPTTVPLATAIIDAADHVASAGILDGKSGIGGTFNNDYAAYELNFGSGVSRITGSIAAVNSGGSIEVHLGSAAGKLLGTIKVGVTGGWGKYTSQSAAVSSIAGVQTVYLVFKGGSNAIANLYSLKFS